MAEAILSQCTGRRAHLRPILMMIRDTGLRPSEMFRAKVEDLDFNAHTLEVRMKNSKTNRRRYVGLTLELELELKRLIDDNNLQSDNLIFGITNTVKRAYAAACQAAGVEGVTLYSWRHLFGTDLHRANVPPKIAMKVMGHLQDATHMRYVNDDQVIAAQSAQAIESYRKTLESASKRESGGEKKKTA